MRLRRKPGRVYSVGRSQRDKGARGERELVNDLRSVGIPARRVPLSGAAEGYPGDVVIDLAAGPIVVENKRRAKPIATLENWLAAEGASCIAFRADHGARRWVVTDGLMMRLLSAARDKEAALVGVLEGET